MASSHASPLIVEDDESRASPVPSTASNNTLINPFQAMMAPESSWKKPILRDRCFRPTTTYTTHYDPSKPPNLDNDEEYSPYDFGEPLFDDRKVQVARLPTGFVLVGATKRKLRQWVWKVGYNLRDTTKVSNNLVWCCKLCMYFPIKSADQVLIVKVITIPNFLRIANFTSTPIL
jgi:hypothetical protein